VNEYRVDAESGARGEGFSRQFEQDSLVHVRTKYRMALRELAESHPRLRSGSILKRMDGVSEKPTSREARMLGMTVSSTGRLPGE
jgi:hypothetical protein